MADVSVRNAALCLGAMLAVACVALQGARATTFHVLHAFAGGPGDGRDPWRGALYRDASGNLFGTTIFGGASDLGTVFKIAPDGSETVLHSFAGDNDGAEPLGVVGDAKGDLYGVMTEPSLGAVFEITSAGEYKVLHRFKGGSDGMGPFGNPILDSAGNLYGTTMYGGAAGSDCSNGQNGCGTVFKIAADGTFSIVHAFAGGDDGSLPTGLILDASGNLIGATISGGGKRSGGTIYRLAPDGTETILHAFKRLHEGMGPQQPLTLDVSGNIYGTTSAYGHLDEHRCPYHDGCGTLFKLAPDGGFVVLHAFTGRSDGARPSSPLILDGAGNLTGATAAGGKHCLPVMGCGTVFRLAPDGTMTILHNGSERKGNPGALIAGAQGVLYGAEFPIDGRGDGSVFKMKP
jgi:uncharacterized repeat protein (TIGR03803 family)